MNASRPAASARDLVHHVSRRRREARRSDPRSASRRARVLDELPVRAVEAVDEQRADVGPARERQAGAVPGVDARAVGVREQDVVVLGEEARRGGRRRVGQRRVGRRRAARGRARRGTSAAAVAAARRPRAGRPGRTTSRTSATVAGPERGEVAQDERVGRRAGVERPRRATPRPWPRSPPARPQSPRGGTCTSAAWKVTACASATGSASGQRGASNAPSSARVRWLLGSSSRPAATTCPTSAPASRRSRGS